MAARCAGCLKPIAQAEKFVLLDTEVFHRVCIAQGSQSLVTRLRVRINTLTGEVANARSLAAEVPRLRQSIDLANADARRIDAERGTLQNALVVARAAKDAALRDSEYWRDRDATTTTNLTRVTAERDRLARELAELRAQLAKPEAVVEREDPNTNKELDAIAVRFGLLEFE